MQSILENFSGMFVCLGGSRSAGCLKAWCSSDDGRIRHAEIAGWMFLADKPKTDLNGNNEE